MGGRSVLPSVLCAFSLWAGLLGLTQAAGPLQSSIRVQAEVAKAGAQSQERIDRMSDETQVLLQEYRLTMRELESLRSYDDHLERMVSAQEESIATLQQQLGEVQLTYREVIPLMARMVETLAEFVDRDVPFLLAERHARVQALRDLMDRPDASVAEKYRRVMEAYQAETEYGRTIEAYRGTLQWRDRERTVDFLRIGRVALIYRSLDGREAGVWEPAARSWAALSREYRSSLNKGFRIAKKQAAPDVLKLPIPAPQVLP